MVKNYMKFLIIKCEERCDLKEVDLFSHEMQITCSNHQHINHTILSFPNVKYIFMKDV